jgi:hypothetical protein
VTLIVAEHKDAVVAVDLKLRETISPTPQADQKLLDEHDRGKASVRTWRGQRPALCRCAKADRAEHALHER